MIRSYHMLPRIPDAGLLERYLDTIGVIVPLARTNLITNPSFETNSDGIVLRGTVSANARTTDQSYHGAYSYAITPSTAATTNAMNGGLAWGSLVPTASGIYAVSVKFRGGAGVAYRLYVENSVGSVELTTVRFTGTGRWQWIWLVYQEASVVGGTRNYVIIKDNNRDGGVFYVDGLQVELITDGYLVPTTYIDGDQRGLIPNQFPPAYGWNGTPHASTSYRIGQTRAGGRVVLLKNLGFLLTAIIGLGLAPPQHQALTFAQLDGGQYQNTLKPPRQFSLTGRVVGSTPNEADTAVAQLGDLLDRDLIAQRQPLVLTMQAQACGNDRGERVFIPALYSGGLEGNVVELPSQQVPITFTQYLPYVLGGDQGTALTVQQSVSNANAIVKRAANGTWSALGTGTTTGTVFAINQGLDGKIYAGGDFTAMGGVASTRGIAFWDGSAWNAMGTGGAVGTQVNAIAIAPNGDIYIGGSFTLMGGVANTNRIARWNGSAWSALSTGANGIVTALAFGPDGTLYVGGGFTTIGGVAANGIASWNGSAFSALGSGVGGGNVVTLAVGPNGTLYAGGTFPSMGGVANTNFIAKWNGSAWSALGTGMSGGTTVSGLAFAFNGLLYAGGDFTAAGGVTAASIAVWNGVQWATVGSSQPFSAAASVAANGMSRMPTGEIAIGGSMTSAGGITLPDRMTRWNGATYLPFDIDLPGTATPFAFFAGLDGSFYVGFNTNGTATATAITTATNSGNVDIAPTLVLYGPSSGTSRIYQIVNTTTGQAIYFNLTLSAGEIATLTLDPTNNTFVSTFRGNILNTILPGSQQAFWNLQPGANTISFFAASSSVVAIVQWPIAYTNLNKALYQATTP